MGSEFLSVAFMTLMYLSPIVVIYTFHKIYQIFGLYKGGKKQRST